MPRASYGAALSQQALAVGKTPAKLAASVVENLYTGRRAESLGAEPARAQFEHCFGSVNLGRPIGAATTQSTPIWLVRIAPRSGDVA